MSKLEQWQQTIDDWKFSGLSKKEYCQNHNIKVHNLHYWIGKFNKGPELIGQFLPFTEKIKPTDHKPIELFVGYARIITSLPCLSEVLLELDLAGLLYDPT